MISVSFRAGLTQFPLDKEKINQNKKSSTNSGDSDFSFLYSLLSVNSSLVSLDWMIFKNLQMLQFTHFSALISDL